MDACHVIPGEPVLAVVVHDQFAVDPGAKGSAGIGFELVIAGGWGDHFAFPSRAAGAASACAASQGDAGRGDGVLKGRVGIGEGACADSAGLAGAVGQQLAGMGWKSARSPNLV